MNADRTLLTDPMWANLSPHLPGQAGQRGVTARDTRRFVEAVLWLGRTGVAWRDLPSSFGHWHRVYVRFARWRDTGVWQRVAEWLIAHDRRLPHPRQRQVQVDSTSIRVHQHAAGGAKKKGRKRSAPAAAGAPASST